MAGFVAAVGVLVLGSCARGVAGEPAVRPLAATDAPPGTAQPTPTTATTTTAPAAPSALAPATSRPDEAPDTALRSLVDDVLLTYDRVLTDLAADPAGRAPTGTPQRAAWDATVLPGSGLSSGMLGWLVRRHHQDGTIVVPDGSGLSYRHRALLVEPPVHGAVSFTWCGHSPGLGIDAATGEVVDDDVAHSHGTGQLRSLRGRWVLEALDESDLVLLPPGSEDPCPAEVDGLSAAESADGSATPPEVGR